MDETFGQDELFPDDSDDDNQSESKMVTGGMTKSMSAAAASAASAATAATAAATAAATPVVVSSAMRNGSGKVPLAPDLPSIPKLPSPTNMKQRAQNAANRGKQAASNAASNAQQAASDAVQKVRARLPSYQQDSSFWRDHAEWQRQVLQTDWNAAVKNPIKSGGFSSYVSYEVALQPMGYSVRRRYSDFVWLQELLQRRYVGILISPLPPKEGMMSKKGFLKLRMRHLNIFLSKLISNPYIRSDTSLMDFFSVGETKQWALTKKSAAKEQKLMMAKQAKGDSSAAVAAVASKPNIGQAKWQEAIDTYKLPDNTDTMIRRVQQQVTVLERLMKAVLKSSNKLVQQSHQYAMEMGEFNVAFQALVHTEQTSGLGAGDASSPELTTILSKMGYMFNSWQEVLKFQPGVNQMLLHEVLNFELRMVQSLQDLFKQRQSMLNAAQKAQMNLTNVELKKQGALSRGKGADAKKLDTKISDALLGVKRCNYVVNFMTKGLFYSELERFTADKVTAFREMMAQFAAAHAAYAKRLHDQWELSLESVADQVNKEFMVAKANATLENLDMSGGIEFGEVKQ
jgi:hypothetical protein